MMLITVASILTLCSITGALEQCLAVNNSPEPLNPESKQSLRQARFDFALDTVKNIVQQCGEGNIFFSPYSLHEALTLAYFSASGTTEDALKTALRIPESQSKVDIQRFYGFEKSMRRFKESSGNKKSRNEFRTANKLFVTNQRRVRQCMFDLLGEELEQIDFRDNPEQIRQNINEWVSNVTERHINDLIPGDGVTIHSDLVLVNAVYFKGFWQNSFDFNHTKTGDFYTNSTHHIPVLFMHQEADFSYRYSEQLGAQVLALPYEGDEISMYVFMPRTQNYQFGGEKSNNADSVEQIIKRIASTREGRDELREIIDNPPEPFEITVLLPKFSVKKQLSVKNLFNDLGAGELLSVHANLKGLLAEGEPSLHLEDAVHQAAIEVTEEGTTAAAATAIIQTRIGSAEVRFDHPFLYLIYNKPTRTILFAGVYRTSENT